MKLKRLSRNARLGLICAVGVLAMTGMAFAAVPAYRMFCQVTGFDGTTMVAAQAPDRVLDREITVRFDTNVRGGLPWRFEAEQLTQTVRVGESRLAFFRVTNTSDRPVSGIAAYNVVPVRAGQFFLKLRCFCFEAQTLQPGETMEFPIQYFIDETIETEPDGRGVRDIVLSYTFYPAEGFDEALSASGEAASASL